MFIKRTHLLGHLEKLLQSFRAVELVGPRQVGKTTIARQWVHPDSVNYFDLEDPVSRQRLSNPMSALSELEGLVVIDEIQHLPQLPEVLRVLMDRPNRIHQPGQFLLLGSTRASHSWGER
jgi:predicted AAA+ superfamily ATPase